MPSFQYIANANGQRHTGVVEAASLAEAAKLLRQQGKSILELRPGGTAAGGGTQPGANAGSDLLAGFMISKAGLEMALRQLASLLKAGVPILTALRSIAEHAPKSLGFRLNRVAEAVRQGNSLSKAMGEFIPGLGKVTSGLLSVGEANGTIDQMSAYAADLMERSRKIRSQMTQAFAYPVVVMLAAMGVGYYMVNKVFPVIMKFLQKSRASTTLPLPTRMVIWLNDFLTSYGIFLLLAPVVAAAVIWLLRRKASTGEMLDQASLRLPVLGGALVYHANTMWCLTLGALLRSGLDVVAAVELVERTMGNWLYAAQFARVREMLRQGSSLGKCLSATTLKSLAPMAHTMVSVSEESGGMSESLAHVAAYSEEQLNRRVAIIGKMVEPAIFVFIGGFVGLVYFGFFMAMVSATNAAR